MDSTSSMPCIFGQLGVGPNIVVGAILGTILGSVAVLGVHFALSEHGYKKATEFAAEHDAKIRSMVDMMRDISGEDFVRELQTLTSECGQIQSILPAVEDRLCYFCLSERSEVNIPVKTSGCQGQHFMCKEHFQEWIQTSRGRDVRCCICQC